MNIRKILIVFGIAMLSLIGVQLLRWHQRKTAFRISRPGQQRSVVLAGLGKPWATATCGATFGGVTPSGCAKEVIYAAPWAPLLPEYLAFFFDRNDILMETYRYVSP